MFAKVFRLACIACFSSAAVLSQQSANEAHGSNFDIVADRVIRMPSGGKSIYSVSYHYDFRNLRSIFIDDVGAMPPNGKMSYLTAANHIVFRSLGSNGAVVADLPLEETVHLASVAPMAPIAQLPRQADFPPQFVTRSTSSPAPAFRSSVYNILGKYFECMPLDDGSHSLVWTTYAPLQLKQAPKNVLGKIAVLVSFPFDPASGGFAFRIHALALEGRSQSDEWREPQTQAVLDAAKSFVDQLAGELVGVTAQR